MSKTGKSVFDSPLLSSKVKSANPKLIPEGGLGYFIGPTLALIANAVLNGYLNKYFTDILKIQDWGRGLGSLFLTLLPIISVIFVVAGNIIVGRLMDRNKSKAGKARPLLLLSVPIAILALLILFVFMPFANGGSSGGTKVLVCIMAAVGYNLWFSVAYPFYYTSHAALVSLSTRNGKSRSLLATISNATNLSAMGLTTMVLPFFISILFVEGNPQQSHTVWKFFAVGLMVITFLGVLTEYYFTRERVTEEQLAMENTEKVEKPLPVKEQLKICFKDKFWVIIILFFFLYQLGGMLKNVSQLYFCQAWLPDAQTGEYTVGSGGTYHGLLSIIGAIPTALGMLIAWPLSNKIGKGNAILYGAIIATIGGAIGFLVPFVPTNLRFAITVISFVIKALGSTPAMYLSLALLGDILDHQEALNGKRTDGITMSIYGAIMAGMAGIATGILNVGLVTSGYNPDTQAGITAIQWPMLIIFIGGETLCYLGIAIFFIFMRVERFSKLDHDAIVADQKEKCARMGKEYVSTEERMIIEQEEADRKAEEAYLVELAAKCKKKGLDYEVELEKHNAVLAKKKADADAKAQAAEEKKAAKEALLKEKEAAMTDEEKEARAKKEQIKAEKDAKLAEEFDVLRETTRESRERALFE